MGIYALGELVPRIDVAAYVHPEATIIGDVTVGAESSIWPGAVLRGDYGSIVVGERTSIQDGSVIHATAERPTIIGDDCVIGHLAHLEGCVIHNGALVGSGAIVLHDVVIGEGATVGAGAVVRQRTVVSARALVVGVPGVVREQQSDIAAIREGAANYVENGRRYRHELRLIGHDE